MRTHRLSRLVALLLCAQAHSENQEAPELAIPLPASTVDQAAPESTGQPPPPPTRGLARWLDPSTAPFIPVPEIDVNPNSGTTLGVLPTWLVTDDQAQIRKIVAPDLVYNPNFGVGARGRIFSYPSVNTQWSVVGGGWQRVQRQFEYEYQAGRLRDSAWSFRALVDYDRDGTPRFYGVGNRSEAIDETNYTNEQEFVQTTVGWNLTHVVQIGYTLRARTVDVQPGTLAGIASIDSRFGRILGIGSNHEVLNRLEITYDTRDDPSIPTTGGAWVAYGGVAARDGLFNDSLYSVVGLDGRQLWPMGTTGVLAGRMALRYMPGATDVPFWSLSSIGGDRSVVGEQQPLRGYGPGRFYDRNAFSSSLEYRRHLLSLGAVATHVEIELTPFVDVGEVFAHSRTSPVRQLHRVAGLGFRGIARPFVVGFVDVGYGSEGVAAFTGINYPF